MSGLIHAIFHPSSTPRASKHAADDELPNGDTEGTPRGKKRKSKPDPYEDMDEDVPPNTPPSSRSRRKAETQGSPGRGRPSAGRIQRRGRPSAASLKDAAAAEESRVDASANLARAQAPDAARLHPDPEEVVNSRDSAAPVANMGGLELAQNNTAAAAAVGQSADKASGKGKQKATQPESDEIEAEQDNREEHEIESLLKHRMAHDGNVELLVHWVDEEEADATWEAEEEIQTGAAETLYAYWRSQGGRLNALFIKPNDPPPQSYHAYKILNHQKKSRGGFQFEVQWVGHPAIPGETSHEAETKLKKVAPEMLDEYWESVGGRARHLAKRGRNKKTAD